MPASPLIAGLARSEKEGHGSDMDPLINISLVLYLDEDALSDDLALQVQPYKIGHSNLCRMTPRPDHLWFTSHLDGPSDGPAWALNNVVVSRLSSP